MVALGTPAALQYSLTVRPSWTWVLSGLTWTLGPLPPADRDHEISSLMGCAHLGPHPCPLTLHMEHGPGCVLPRAAVELAQVLTLI